MKVDTPGIGLTIVFVISAVFLMQLAFELYCMKYVYSTEAYTDVLEREKNMKAKIVAEKNKLLYGQVSANKRKQ